MTTQKRDVRPLRTWTVGQNVISEPSFDVVLRGYHRRDVDSYTHLVEEQLTALITDQQDSQSQIRILTDELHQVRTALADARRMTPPPEESLRYRHLGLRVEQILKMAEDQADEITGTAEAEAETLRGQAQRLLEETQARMAQAAEDFELAINARRAEATQELADMRRMAIEDAHRAAADADRMRETAEAALAAAQEETQSTTRAAREAAEQMRATIEQEAGARWTKTQEQVDATIAGAEAYARQTRTAADAYADEVRAAADTFAAGAHEAAEQAASDVLAQAEQLAAQIRTGSERHGARLRSSANVVIEPATEPTADLAPAG